jgi:hypothetical protein
MSTFDEIDALASKPKDDQAPTVDMHARAAIVHLMRALENLLGGLPASDTSDTYERIDEIKKLLGPVVMKP